MYGVSYTCFVMLFIKIDLHARRHHNPVDPTCKLILLTLTLLTVTRSISPLPSRSVLGYN